MSLEKWEEKGCDSLDLILPADMTKIRCFPYLTGYQKIQDESSNLRGSFFFFFNPWCRDVKLELTEHDKKEQKQEKYETI